MKTRLFQWQQGWSLARGLPLPVPDGEGIRVEVGWPDQLRRYVFAEAGPAVSSLARAVREPYVHLKACATEDQLMSVLPSGWQFEQLRFFMACAGPMDGDESLPAGYHYAYDREHMAHRLRVLATDGSEAAVGRVVVHDGCAVFDRIETQPGHQRRGLASCLMRSLDAIARRDGTRERLLVATGAGRALYLRLGWHELSPYATAVHIPA